MTRTLLITICVMCINSCLFAQKLSNFISFEKESFFETISIDKYNFYAIDASNSLKTVFLYNAFIEKYFYPSNISKIRCFNNGKKIILSKDTFGIEAVFEKKGIIDFIYKDSIPDDILENIIKSIKYPASINGVKLIVLEEDLCIEKGMIILKNTEKHTIRIIMLNTCSENKLFSKILSHALKNKEIDEALFIGCYAESLVYKVHL